MRIYLSSLHGSRAGCTLLGVLALVLAQSLGPTLRPPVQDILPVLIHLQLHDDHLARMDANINSGSVSLFPLDSLNVDPELASVALYNLAHLLALVMAPHNLNFIVLPDWHAPDAILCPQLLGEGGGH